MTRGYSLQLHHENLRASSELLGVRLGRACIEHNISVIEVAEQFGVSRQTVYNWFRGEYEPGGAVADRVASYIAALR